MLADGTTFYVLAVLFGATFVRSAFGFGEALIAVPLLALLMPVEVAAPVAVLVSITVALVILAQDWRHVHFRSACTLTVSTLFGAPLGLLVLVAVAESVIKAILAGVIIAFSAWSLRNRRRFRLRDERFAWAFGFLAGVLGGAYGMNGPPLVVYGALRRWSPQHFRATLQGYFLPASILTMAGYGFVGLWTAEVNRWFLLALPAVLMATLLGRVANRRLDARTFLVWVHVALIAIGVLLLLQSIQW